MRRTHTTVVLAAVLSLGCYEYRANAVNVTPATEGTKPGGDVVVSVAWGLAKQEPKIDCNNQPLDEVTVRDNFGFTLITILTLGFVSPKKIEWRCAPPRPTDGTIRDDPMVR
ncbi:MAG: hypothetical protein ACKVZ0_20365 [Gemmatimonadales bacterium]